MTTTLVFEEVESGETHVVHIRRLLVAGFTGRDTAAVQKHIDELAALGVPVPDTTPTLYRLDPALVRQAAVLVVGGSNTSGEVEPVVVAHNGELFLTVGSDHTDRDVEREDIAASKAACAKVVGTTCVPLGTISDWDAIEMSSEIDGAVGYQRGTLAALRSLESVRDYLEGAEGVTLTDGDVLFLGTVAVEGAIRPSDTFSASLHLAEVPDPLTLSYRVVDLASSGKVPLQKPELEFLPVDEVGWTVPEVSVPGMTERILARDPSSGTATRMLRFEPGTETSEIGVLRHDFWEEVFILSGVLHDLTLGQSFGAGTYACRPPGMPHGPWVSEEGCITFEVRYPAI